jgi:hypothetical protein
MLRNAGIQEDTGRGGMQQKTFEATASLQLPAGKCSLRIALDQKVEQI